MDDAERKKWNMSFGEAYDHMIAHRAQRGEGAGPIDILAKGHRRMYALYAIRPGAVIDWKGPEKPNDETKDTFNRDFLLRYREQKQD